MSEIGSNCYCVLRPGRSAQLQRKSEDQASKYLVILELGDGSKPTGGPNWMPTPDGPTDVASKNTCVHDKQEYWLHLSRDEMMLACRIGLVNL